MTGSVIDHTHDAAATSWEQSANGHSDFPVQNLPFGIFSRSDGTPCVGTAVGDRILDVAGAATDGLLPGANREALNAGSLNRLLGMPASERLELRRRIFELLTNPAHQDAVLPHLYHSDTCAMHLPAVIGDYSDFYVGIHHASNVGSLFRPEAPLLPNYKYVPIGYHGRASSIRPSGAPVVRPTGQYMLPNAPAPTVGPSIGLDFELELAV